MENSAPRIKGAVVSVAVCVLCAGLVFLSAGCPQPPLPPAAAILAGDWATTSVEGADVVVTFDAQGVVVTITGTAENGTVATLTVTGGTTTLDGSAVTIVVPTDSGQVTFEATLSDDQNTMTGSSTREIVIGDDLEITIPAGDLTLTRIVEPDCETDADCADGETCVDGECVAPPSGCQSDEDCEDGEFCDTGTGECVDNVNLYATTYFSDDGAGGPVHTAHLDGGVADCTSCHHSDPPAGFTVCATCHSEDPDVANSYKDVAHDMNESGGGCRLCHDADWDNCAFCHPLLDE